MAAEFLPLPLHARHELAKLKDIDEVSVGVILRIVELFYQLDDNAVNKFFLAENVSRLLKHKNLTAITDDPEEWFHHDTTHLGWEAGFWQNTRNSEAYSHDGGKTYYLLGEVGGLAQDEYIFHTSVIKR